MLFSFRYVYIHTYRSSGVIIATLTICTQPVWCCITYSRPLGLCSSSIFLISIQAVVNDRGKQKCWERKRKKGRKKILEQQQQQTFEPSVNQGSGWLKSANEDSFDYKEYRHTWKVERERERENQIKIRKLHRISSCSAKQLAVPTTHRHRWNANAQTHAHK